MSGTQKKAVPLVVILAMAVLAAQVSIAFLLSQSPTKAWAVALGFVGLVCVLTLPRSILTLALPATYLYYRVGPASTEISLADVMLGVALVAALPFVPWRSPVLRSMLRIVALYLLVLAIAIIAVPSKRAVIEWGHRAFLAGGGVVVGAAITQTTLLAVRALRAFLAASAVVAAGAIFDALAHWGSGTFPAPAYPFGIHKNAAGFLLACALLVLIVAPGFVALPRILKAPAIALLFTGMAACQSRGAVIALVSVLVVWVLYERRITISPLVLVGAALLIAMTYFTINATFASDTNDGAARFNSVNSRVATYDAALRLWRHDPLVGVGLKFWRDPALAAQTAFGEPHDLVVSALAESGLIGLSGLVVLVVGGLVVVRRSRAQLAALAGAILLANVVDSLVGIYWVAGTLTFAWIVAGLACGERSAPGPAREDVLAARAAS